MTSRRVFVGFALCAAPLAYGASDFWNKKDPDAWSSDDIQRLMTNSPWAKTVAVDLLAPNPSRYGNESGPVADPAGINGNGGGAVGGGIGGPTVASGSMVGPVGSRGLGGGRPGDRDALPTDAATATVRWESAGPIRAATKGRVPDSFAGRYVIGLSSFPMLGKHDDMVDKLKSSATLQAKGRPPVQAGMVVLKRDGSEILFGFSRELFTLNATDKDLYFSLNTGEVSLRAKFEPKDMIYRGELAI